MTGQELAENMACLLSSAPLGKPVRPELYSDRFRGLCREAGLRTIHLHLPPRDGRGAHPSRCGNS